ncbi:ECF RNA polymerase sigma factor SigW [Pseudodesulfovibrio hydrargyri]|uniref:ECF RNA polymerase sigma factor SigW n=1 Tax=Pseudodesulfovibrio hydrargyri TaxID=2125990 RepID=A0A1J5N704_9BACT|nr:RNA polymerase sigma factor [Pseudodesulfovibrio hydrargyri]OIQ49079.1 ECF RNA polymerase sigma factor SigW [Pseudodesulfovibrio hydrargyri]
MKEKREAEIVRNILLGEVRLYGDLVREYQGPVYNLMLRMTGDADVSADLAQDAFVRAYEKLETFNQRRRFFPWLYTLALNVARDWLRKEGRDRHVFVEDASVMVREQDRRDESRAMNDRLDGAKAFETVMALDPKYREALILRYRHDFTMQEIASTLGIGVSAVKMRLSRGLDMVRHRFDGGSNP